MGVDWLDLTFRLEREFDVKLTKEFTESFTRERTESGRVKATATDVYDMVVAACVAQRRPVPKSAWNRVKRSLHGACGARPSAIRRTSKLVDDLGCS